MPADWLKTPLKSTEFFEKNIPRKSAVVFPTILCEDEILKGLTEALAMLFFSC